MSFIDCSPSPGPSSPSRKHIGYVCMSTVDDLSYTPSAEEKDRDAAQIVATGRRSWKTLKGKGEAVWPPHLEAALIEALEKYRPDESRSTKTLGRFSMRNRFISDYIFETTGKRRTPKQVGSRLQQLRDTCKSERILRLISRRHTDNNEQDASTLSSDGHSSSATPPPADFYCVVGNQKVQRRHDIWVNIILEQLSWPSPPPVVHIVNNNKLMPLVIHLSPLAASPLPYESGTHCLASMQPTITFSSPFALAPQCSYSIFDERAGLPFHREIASLKCQSDPMQSSGWMYRASLVPEMWKTLCRSSSPTRYTITQDLFAADASGDGAEPCVSIVYKFIHHESSTGFQAPQQGNAYVSYLGETLPPFSAHSPTTNNTRGWCATATLDWSTSFSDNSIFTPTTTPAYHSTVPATAPRGGRSAICGQYENWGFGQKLAHATASLQYC
ncbi:hypothetical protein L218DRAFT_1074027 [Marasmius fiardii PR-910]|nr:hypothetical protein L218DRAFT_1074027 [Marasmius fiardii PR-910]